jgi:hypothetical protein
MLSMPYLAAAVLAATPIAQSSQPSPIRAYRDQAVFSTAPPNSKDYTLQLADASGVHPLAAEDHRALEADVSRGPDGKPAIIVAQARAIYLLDPKTGSRKRIHTTHNAAYSPVIWGKRIAWIEGKGTVYSATLGHKAKKVPTPKGGAYDLDLFGNRLALALSTNTDLDNQQLWLQEVDGTRRKLVKKMTMGESGRYFAGPSFDGGALYFAQGCNGDPSGCPGGKGVAYRYASGKLTRASVPSIDLGGFAQAGGNSYWVTENYGDCLDDHGVDAPCVVERDRLTFRK